MLASIKINNLRNLEFEKYIDIKSLTVLLGKNSSGKSSFLRTFPLFKQSIEARRSTPLLWYGRLVDFGSFKESKNKYLLNDDIQFGFKLKNKTEEKTIEILLTKEKDVEYLKEIKIIFNENEIYLIANEHGELERITVNKENMLLEKFNFTNFKGTIPSEIANNRTKKKQNIFFYSIFDSNLVDEEKLLLKLVEIFYPKIEKSNLKMKGLNPEIKIKVIKFLDEFIWDSKKTRNYDEKQLFELIKNGLIKTNLLKILFDIINKDNKKIEYSYDKSYFLKKMTFNSIKEPLAKLKNLLIFNNLNNILNSVNTDFNNIFNNVFYIGPLRATAERYYRIQGLGVDDINPDGNNLPMYLKSLTRHELEAFSDWTNENFNFEPTISSGNEGHISLQIKQGENNINLADTGFGFSQILPIILQIWRKVSGGLSRENTNQIFVIEQPELHLHPGMQAMLVDVIMKSIKIAKDRKIKVKFIIETHSETIINRIGRHVMEELVDENNINLLIFNKTNKNKLEIKETRYDSDGAIEEWPFGFFQPGVVIR